MKGIIGFDPGYGFVKAVFSTDENGNYHKILFPAISSPKKISFVGGEGVKSIAPPPDIFDTFNLDQDFYFVIDNKSQWRIGRSVLMNETDAFGSTLGMKRNIEREQKVWLLSIAAATSVTLGVKTISVAWTTPIKNIDVEKRAINEANIKGLHQVDIIGSGSKFAAEFEIDKIGVIEQGISTIYDIYLGIEPDGTIKTINPSLKNSRIHIFDIGFNTINYALIDHLKIDQEASSRFTEAGAFQLVNPIYSYLKNNGVDNISLTTIQEEVIMKNNTTIETFGPKGKESIDLATILPDLKERVFKESINPHIQNIVSSKYKAGDKLLFTGGSVKLFANQLKQFYDPDSDRSIIFVEDAQFTNAVGAWKGLFLHENS